MNNRFVNSRAGLLVLLAAVIAAFWSLPARAVTYGTHSKAYTPVVSIPMRHSDIPMVSGGTVRSYAHYGHATMPSTSSGSGYRIHTLSSSTVHTIGSGGGGGGGASSGGSSSSARRISYSGGSVSMPALAVAMPTRTSASSQTTETYSPLAGQSEASGHIGSIRRAPGITGDEEEGDEAEDGGKYWIWDGEQWVEAGDVPVGTTKIEGGKTYRWNGSEWVLVGDQLEPGVPVGDTPWWLMTLLLVVYGAVKKVGFRRNNG